MYSPLVIYHAHCLDGFGAAYAIWKLYSDAPQYYAAEYNRPPPNVDNQDVIMVDFSYKKDIMINLAKSAKSVLLLDHHETALELQMMLDLGVIKGKIDMEKSGAVLAWEHFHSRKRVPKLLKHIQDRDLWQFKMKFTREIYFALSSHPFDFELWDSFVVAELKAQGVPIIRFYNLILDQLKTQVRTLEIGGYPVPAVNSSYTFASDVASIISKGHVFGAVWSVTQAGIKFSLRSSKNGLDVSKIAEKYGGGGHINAAAFEVKNLDDPIFKRLLHSVVPSKPKKKVVKQAAQQNRNLEERRRKQAQLRKVQKQSISNKVNIRQVRNNSSIVSKRITVRRGK